MGKEAVHSLEMGILPEIGLIAFVVAFLAILAYVFLLPKKERDDAKNLPLNDSNDANIQVNHD